MPSKLYLNFLRNRLQTKAKAELSKNTELWATLQEYLSATRSTGCSYADYHVLYKHIRTQRPTEILECGPGVSTIIMAYALMENEREDGVSGRITALEDKERWFNLACEIMPDAIKPYVELLYSPRKEFCFSMFRGVGYSELPAREYDFVFIDGPGTTAPSDKTRAFDFDFIRVVMQSSKPVTGIIDKRLSTVYAMQHIFGVNHIRYDPILELTFCGPCSSKDVRDFRSSTRPFYRDRVKGKDFIHFDIERERLDKD